MIRELMRKLVGQSRMSQTDKIYRSMTPCTRVLFVDDDALINELLASMPAKFKIDLKVVSTANEARRVTEEEQGLHPFDVAVIDVGIVNGDGIELFQWLKQRYPSLRPIFFTGYSPNYMQQKMAEIGYAPVFYKPERMDEESMEKLFSAIGAMRQVPESI